jgi:membrane protease YdiL (CAAX protease family)
MATSVAGKARPRGWGWLRRRPVLLFVIVTFVVSYGLGVPALMVASSAPGLNDVAELYLGRFFVVIGPTCGALAAVTATSGRATVVPFVRGRLSLSRGSWLAAIVLPLFGLALVSAAYTGAGLPLQAIAIALREAWPLLLAHFVLQALVVGLGEELGWRGWLLPKLAATHGLSRAALFTGIVWYLWHFPILMGGLRDAFWFALAIAGLSALLSAIWLRSGRRAALPAIAHGSINAPVVFFTAVLPNAGHHQAAWELLCGMLAVCGLGAMLWARSQWRKVSP